MATVQSILNKIASMASRTGLFSIQKGEFFGTLTDITNKISEVNNNLNSVAKSLIWQAPVANFAALGTTYPTPAIGWAAMVTDEGFIYSWNGTAWKNTGLTAFPSDVQTISGYVKNWILSDSYEVSNIINDVNGVISSAIIKWPDGNIGSISNVNSTHNGITSIRYNRSDGKYGVMTISYSVTGEIIGQNVELTGF